MQLDPATDSALPAVTTTESGSRHTASGVRYAIPRALVALAPGRHHVVEASAGTGKTYLIEHRVVDLLLTTNTPIERILVVTFTEKATAELRYRVRRLIERVEAARSHSAGSDEPHWVIDGAARHRLSDALLGFDRAAIHTIHGFCQRVLSENAFSSRRLFAQTQVTGEAAFGEAFKSALRESFAREEQHKPYLAAWYRSGRSVDDLERLLFRCANQDGRLVPDFDPAAIASRLRAAAAELPAVSEDDDEPWRAALKRAGLRVSTARALVRRLAALKRCLNQFVLTGDVGDFLANFERAERELKGSRERLLPYIVTRLESAEIADSDVDLATVQRVILDLDRALVPLVAAVAQRFLPQVQVRLDEDKNRRGQFDFQDMLRLTWQSLQEGDAEEVCARLRSRYRYALIDEFQDTDELQWQIFRRLYLDDGGSDNELCVIGDPKQAIYGFRGADVYTYLDARRQMCERGGQVTNLVENYRSTDGVVRAYNTILSERFFTGEIRYDHPAVAATALILRDAEGTEPAPVCVLHVTPEHGKLRADSLRQALLTRMASEIRRILFAPDGGLWVGLPGALARIRAGDIFVLTRTTAESNEVAERLRGAGIPCAIYKQEGLFQSREAREVRDLLRGVSEPRDRSARFQAWNTRFFGASLSDLPYLANLPETHPFIARLYEWKALADRLAYETLFSRILDQSGIIERELFLEPSERALTNFQHLFELLLEEVMRSRCELHELVQRLERWMADAAEDPQADTRNIQRMESATSAVQVMTIHRAKGLEAKLVFLYGGLGAAPGDEVQVYHRDGERLVHVGHAHRDVAEVVDREREGEDERLCYVALTRAAARLYLPFVAPDQYATPIRGAYAQINRRLEAIVPRVRAGEPSLSSLFAVEAITTGQMIARPPRARAELVKAWRPPEALLASLPPNPGAPAIDYQAVRAGRTGFIVSSYTRMKDVGPAPVRFAGLDPDRPARAPEARAAAVSSTAPEERTEAASSTALKTRTEAASSPVPEANTETAASAISGSVSEARADSGPDSAASDPLASAQASALALATAHTATPADVAGGPLAIEQTRATAPIRVTAIDFKVDQTAAAVRLSEDQLPGGPQSGVFLHALLEQVPLASAREIEFEAWCQLPAIERLFRDAMLRYDRDVRYLGPSQRMVYDALTTPIPVGRQTVPGLAWCERSVREMEFLYPIPQRAHAGLAQALPPAGEIRLERGYIKGFIDLVFEFRGRVYLVDWKSDILADYSPQAVWRQVYRWYWLQAQLYSLALAKMLDVQTEHQYRRRFGGLVFCFLRGLGGAPDEQGRRPGVYSLRPKREELVALERALAERNDYR